MILWRCHKLLSGFLAKGQLPRVSRQSMARVIMALFWELCTDLLAFAFWLRKSPENLSQEIILSTRWFVATHYITQMATGHSRRDCTGWDWPRTTVFLQHAVYILSIVFPIFYCQLYLHNKPSFRLLQQENFVESRSYS